MRVQCIKSIRCVEDASEKLSLQCINIYLHKFKYDKSNSSPHSIINIEKSTMSIHNDSQGDSFIMFEPLCPSLASDLSHSQCGCQVNTILNNIMTWLPCQPGKKIFSFKILRKETKKEKANIDRDTFSWEETRGPVRPHSSWYYIETVEHWFSQCCDSCSCLADICFHPSPCSDAFAQRAAEAFVLSNECCLEKYRCMLLQIYYRSVKGLIKSKCLLPFCLCHWYNSFDLFYYSYCYSQRDWSEGVFVLQSNGTFIINVNH